jgi:hypothetical protein
MWTLICKTWKTDYTQSAKHTVVHKKKYYYCLKGQWQLSDDTASIRCSVNDRIINEYGVVDWVKNSLAFAKYLYNQLDLFYLE